MKTETLWICFVFYVFCFNATDRNKSLTCVRFRLKYDLFWNILVLIPSESSSSYRGNTSLNISPWIVKWGHGVRTPLKSWLFQASIRNCLNCVHKCDDHSLLESLDCFLLPIWTVCFNSVSLTLSQYEMVSLKKKKTNKNKHKYGVKDEPIIH